MRLSSLIAVLSLLAVSSHAAETTDYANDVVPILRKYCGGCHNETDAEAGFNLDSHTALLAGGDSGPTITAGAASSSRMLQMIRGKIEPAMPPEDEAQPSEDEIAVIESWIDQGAAGPDGEAPLVRELSTPKIETAADVDFPTTAITVSGDGRFRAMGGFGRVDVVAGNKKPQTTIEGLPGKVNSLQFSRDGKRLLIASGLEGAYGQASIHDVESGKLIVEMVGHRDTMYAAVFSPDGSLVATAGYDRDILVWDTSTGESVRKLTGHNGAIFDLAFSPDGNVLASACADETVKLWNIHTGERLDTLSQSEGEVFSVDFTVDGKFIMATSADHRLRVWRFVSKQKPRINPLVVTRFVDESELVNFSLSPHGDVLVVLTASGNVKVIRTDDWSQSATLQPLGEVGSDICVAPDGKRVWLTSMSGRIVQRELPALVTLSAAKEEHMKVIYMDLGDVAETTEEALRSAIRSQPTMAQSIVRDDVLSVDRGAIVTGSISRPSEEDFYQWSAASGEVWAIDVDALKDSPLDPIVSVLDESGSPVLRVRLQAIRDSYFTFRGKNSTQVNDFRVFNWQEMNLGQYLYASGEVTRLWMHPRGPDSGFDVYPGEGDRWTYFGTTQAAHALGEPAYIVRPLEQDEPPIANGLPVFDVYYENDDDPMRTAGKNSRLLFTAPRDGRFTARVSDTRGAGSESFTYKLTLRAAQPGFLPSVKKPNPQIRRGTGRELSVRVDRIDGFEGPVTFDCENVPAELRSSFPVTIEHGQRFAVGTIWVDEGTESIQDHAPLRITATAMIGGRKVERDAGTLGPLTLGDVPSVIPTLHPIDRDVAPDEMWTLQVRRGETVSARVLLRRKAGFDALVAFGKEDAGRGATQGVYVDNIGLNGLLLPENVSEREFFLTADPTAVPGIRPFFLQAQVDGNVTSRPIMVEVLP